MWQNGASKITIDSLSEVVYKESIGTKMMTLNFVRGRLRSCQPLRHICHWLAWKPLRVQAGFQTTTNRKWPMESRIGHVTDDVTWPRKVKLVTHTIPTVLLFQPRFWDVPFGVDPWRWVCRDKNVYANHPWNCFRSIPTRNVKSSDRPRWMDGWSSVLRPRQHSIGYMGDGFYRSKDPTNSIKVLKGHI